MIIRLAVITVLLAFGCGPSSRGGAPPPKADPGVVCGDATCASNEICVPGGTTQNGVGDTVELPPIHCEPLPAACNGVATCDCVDALCPIGHCSSIDQGQLECLAG